jgi:hypothetical protein
MSTRIFPLLLAGLFLGFAGVALAQPETMGWGNVVGIRVDGHLFEVNSSMCVVKPDWSGAFRSAMERQTNNYSRNGKVETVKIQAQARPGGGDSPTPSYTFSAVESVEDTGPGTAKINLEFTFPAATDIAGAYLCLDLPSSFYSGGSVQLVNPVRPAPAKVSLAPGAKDQNEYVRGMARGLRFTSPRRQLEVMFAEPTEVVIRDDRSQKDPTFQVYLGVLSGKAAEKQVAKKSLSLKVSGEIDKAPAEIAVESSRPGPAYAGLGGNFRLQNPKTDPQVIQYNLDNMRVVFARVEMPWRTWHPTENVDPLEAARAGKVPQAVAQAMDMARRLTRLGMPVIVSAWFPPAWAGIGNGNRVAAAGRGAGGGGGPRGTFLNPAKMDQIKQSLASYLIFLKEKYGVEAVAFSFNESDIGIDVRQTDREHAELIKTLGRHFASRGLATKLLVGDTGDARPVDFINAAMRDPEAVKYIYAVSFHAWRACTDENLKIWSANARTLNVPLLVGEGSTDAAAYRYPQIFLEQSFALREIELYTKILAVGQPMSIIQWQLTADYSLLVGGGVYNDSGPLRPTQRFWNLKQLASSPPNTFYLPVKCDRPGLTCTAFGDIAGGNYAVHVVNTGASRPTTLTGLPAEVKQLRVWVTDTKRGMEEGARIPVTGGKAQFTLDQTSYTTLISAQ